MAMAKVPVPGAAPWQRMPMPVLARPQQQLRSAGQVVCRLSQTGIWQPNHRPITPTISALPGEFAVMGDASRRLRRSRAVFFGSPARGGAWFAMGKPVFSGWFGVSYLGSCG